MCLRFLHLLEPGLTDLYGNDPSREDEAYKLTFAFKFSEISANLGL